MAKWTYDGGDGIKYTTRKRDGVRVYYAEVYWNGKRVTVKGGTTRKAALRAKAAAQREIDNNTFVPPAERKRQERAEAAKRKTYNEVRDLYLAENADRWKRDTWHADLTRQIGERFGSMHLDAITRPMVKAYIDDVLKRTSPTTAAMHLRKFKAFLNWAVAEEYVSTNVARTIKPPSTGARTAQEAEQRTVKAMDPETRSRLLAACEKDYRDVVVFAFATGVRWGELADLTWSRVDFDKRTIRILGTKTGRDRIIGMSDEVAAILKRRRFGVEADGPVFTFRGGPIITHKNGRRWDRTRGAWDRAVERAGLADEGWTPYCTRHTFASEYLGRGGDPWKLAKWCGWTDLSMLMNVYGHFLPEHMQDVAEAMRDMA